MAPTAMVNIHTGKQNTHTCINNNNNKGKKWRTDNEKVLELPTFSLPIHASRILAMVSTHSGNSKHSQLTLDKLGSNDL